MQAHQGHRPDRDCPKLHLWMCLWRRRQAGRHAWPQAGSPRTMVFMPALRRRRKRPTVTSYAANHEHLGGRRGPPDLRAPGSHAPLRASPCCKGQSASILERRRCVEDSQGGEGVRDGDAVAAAGEERPLSCSSPLPFREVGVRGRYGPVAAAL